MPRKPLPKKKLAKLKRRFRELVDWAFNGNLSLAARMLEMPFSTVQQYYQKGPRRIDGKVVTRVNEMFQLGEWIIGEEEPQMPDSFAKASNWRLLRVNTETGPCYWVPELVMWRVRRILQPMVELSGKDEDSMIQVLFATIIEGIKTGLLKAPPVKNFPKMPVVVVGHLGERGLGAVCNVDTAREVHKLCEVWEQKLGIEASRPLRG